MIQLHKVWASTFGIGYVKGGGTVAALVCCLCLYFCWHFDIVTQLGFIIATVIITLSGIWSGNVVERDWGKDSSRVVVDEVAGMCISLLVIPLSFWTMITGLLLFRFFDITKPLGIRRLEALPGGWGVMADDVLAGIYANLMLQVVVLIVR